MKVKSRVNGNILELTPATREVLIMGDGKYAQAITDEQAERMALREGLVMPEVERDVDTVDGESLDEYTEVGTPMDFSDLEAQALAEEAEANAKAEAEADAKDTKAPAKKAPAKKAPAKKTPAKRTPAKKAQTAKDIADTKKQALDKGMNLTANQIAGANEHDDTSNLVSPTDDSVEKL